MKFVLKPFIYIYEGLGLKAYTANNLFLNCIKPIIMMKSPITDKVNKRKLLLDIGTFVNKVGTTQTNTIHIKGKLQCKQRLLFSIFNYIPYKDTQ
jgi:hypothetical protein